MKIKNKNKNINKIGFIIALFFTLTNTGQVNIALGASISAGEMINLTNDSRAEAGIHGLLMNEKLMEAARKKANDMFEFQYFDHNSPSGLTPWDFVRSTGYDYRYAGENLAIDFVTATSAHRALMESSSHRENILNSKYTEIGIVAIEGMFNGNKSIIIVEEFGTPLLNKTSVEYGLNKDIELVLKEKVNGINTSRNDSEEVSDMSKKTEVDKKQNKAESLLEGKKGNEQDDLSLSNSITSFDDENIFSGLFNADQNEILYHNYEDIKDEFQQFKIQSLSCSLDEEKNRKISNEHNLILLAKNLNDKNVVGLIKKAYAEDKQIKKYDYYQESVGLAESNYFQSEFIVRVFLFYAILVSLLIVDLITVIYFYMERGDCRPLSCSILYQSGRG